MDQQAFERAIRSSWAVRESQAAFVLSAAAAAADRVLARSDHTVMPADQFDSLMASLDVPDEAPNLACAAARPRRFIRS